MHFVKKSLPLAVITALLSLFVVGLLLSDPRYFWIDDFQTQFLPAFYEIAQALKHGEMPFLSSSVLHGGAFVGEYQYGVLCLPFLLINFVVWQLGLSLPSTAAALVAIHLWILAAGVYALTRQRNLPPALAAFAATSATLGGWIIQYGARSWICALTCFAWIPWAWWSLRLPHTVPVARRVAWTAFFTYTLFSIGYPFGVLMFAMVLLQCAWSLFREGKKSEIGVLFLGTGLGALFAAPALFCFLAYFTHTDRFANSASVHDLRWIVPLGAYLNLVVPSFLERWLTFFSRKEMHEGVELYCGLIPIIALASGIYKKKFLKKNADLLALLLGTLAFLSLPGFFFFRWSFRWLAFFHLIVALFSAEALHGFLCADTKKKFVLHPRRNLGVMVLLVTAGIACFASWTDRLADFDFTLCLCLLGVVYLADGFLKDVSSRAWLATVLCFGSLFITHYRRPSEMMPSWDFAETIRAPAPLEKGRTYLGFYTFEDFYGAQGQSKLTSDEAQIVRPASLSAFSGLRFVNGYSAESPKGLAEAFTFEWSAFNKPERTRLLFQNKDKLEESLDLLGVSGVIFHKSLLGFSQLLPGNWDKFTQTETDLVVHRHEGILKSLFSPSEEMAIGSIEEKRNQVRAKIENHALKPATLILRRPWFPGYRAWFQERETPLSLRANLVPEVEIPAGASGEVVFSYVPSGFVPGVWVAALGMTVLVLVALRPKKGERRSRRRRSFKAAFQSR